MSFREIRSRPHRDLPDWSQESEEQVYALLEEARLRCEQLRAAAHTEPDRLSLREIHRELGLASWYAGSELDRDRRLALLDNARQQSTRAMLHPAHSPHVVATVAILAEDALLGADQPKHMHGAHVHLLNAMALLAHHV
ncbi:MAG: hypothetical protein WAL22_06195 [Solirubrobacteraceae bacterium]